MGPEYWSKAYTDTPVWVFVYYNTNLPYDYPGRRGTHKKDMYHEFDFTEINLDGWLIFYKRVNGNESGGI